MSDLVHRVRACGRTALHASGIAGWLVAASACASGSGGSGAGSAPGGSAGAAPARTVVGVDGASRDIELFHDRRPTSEALAAAPAVALQALGAAFADVGLEGGPATGQPQSYAANLSVRRALGKVPLSRYLDCSTTATGESRANVDLIKGSVTAQVVAQPGGSALVTQVVARAIAADGASGAFTCSSTGALEARLAEALRARLR
jgi:hypothetical protein